jgi:hypothetical protein
MKKFLLSVSVICLLTISSYSQNRTRTFDNFDTKAGVKIVTPTVSQREIVRESKKEKPSKKNSETMPVSDGLSIRSSNVYKNIRMSSRRSLGSFTTGDSKIDKYIEDSCLRYGVDPLLIYAQMHQESAFKKQATSYKGASGLMQLMPGTARRFGVTKIYDPQQNIEGGVKYMRWLLDKFNGDLVLALAGYNAGEGAVIKYGWNVPPYRETREYVRRITARYDAIGNPNNTIRRVTNTQVAKYEKQEATPLNTFEPNILTIRLPDGSMRLVNQ